MKFNELSRNYKQLNMFIRETMRTKKVSQADIAYMLNLTQASVSNKLSGKTEWTVWELMNVFEYLGIQLSYTERSKDAI